jgi:multidrug efflux pump subunit AcrB
VLLISLMLSWFSALTITPVLIKWWLFKRQSQPVRGPSRPLPRALLPLYQQILHALLLRKPSP